MESPRSDGLTFLEPKAVTSGMAYEHETNGRLYCVAHDRRIDKCTTCNVSGRICRCGRRKDKCGCGLDRKPFVPEGTPSPLASWQADFKAWADVMFPGVVFPRGAHSLVYTWLEQQLHLYGYDDSPDKPPEMSATTYWLQHADGHIGRHLMGALRGYVPEPKAKAKGRAKAKAAPRERSRSRSP